ncbi:protein UXT isoform X4 [Kryptolebias marmoratus]|uniref:protein UXT isoform X4 n=1 Tax=Kryptolebias marmoratus TaxID=37003 RepID=UPI000D52F835|nr:protein UXT isoform X4 [Kryptolebias marmoratus]
MVPPVDSEMDRKVLQYETFISEVLKRDLQKVLEQRDQVYEKISQYLQLKNTIQSLQAKVEDSSRIFVAVGFGFFVEMTQDEALRFIDKKTSQLTAFTEQLTKDSAKIKANIRMVLEGLRELQGLSDLPESQRGDV